MLENKTSREAWLLPAMVFIIVSFSINSVIIRFLVLSSPISPFPLTTIRFISGLVMLTIIYRALPRSFKHVGFKRSNLLGGFFLGAYGFSISFGYLFIGAAAGTLVFFTCAMITMSLYHYLIDRESITGVGILSQFIAFVGILVITFGKIQSVTILGVVLMTLTGIFWGLYSAYGRRFQNSFSYTMHSFVILSAFSLVASSLSLPFLPVSAALVQTSFNLSGLAIALYMGMIGTALSYVLWHWALTRISASQGGIAQMFIPVVGAIIAIIFLGEAVSLTLVLGGILIVSGIYLNNRGEFVRAKDRNT